MIQYLYMEQSFSLRRRQMADNKEYFAQLDTLASKKTLTQDDSKNVTETIEKIAQEFAGEHKLSTEQLNSIRRFAVAHQSDFTSALGGLEGALRQSFLATLSQASEHSKKQETRGTPGKNNLDKAFNKLHSELNKKVSEEDKEKHEKKIIKAIRELNSAMGDKLATQVSGRQKETLKKAFETHKEAFQTAFSDMDNSQMLNDNFITLYNEVTGSKHPTSKEKEIFAETAKRFSAILKDAHEKYATTEPENVEDNTTDPFDDNTPINEDTLYEYISSNVPNLTEEETKAIAKTLNEVAERHNDDMDEDEFFTNFAMSIQETDGLSEEKKSEIFEKTVEWEKQYVIESTKTLLSKEKYTDEEIKKLAVLFHHPRCIETACTDETCKEGLNKLTASLLDTPPNERTTSESKLLYTVYGIEALYKAVQKTTEEYIEKAEQPNKDKTLEILSVKEDERTEEQKVELDRLLLTIGGASAMAAYLSEKNVNELTEYEKEKLRTLSSLDNKHIKDKLAAKLQELDGGPTPEPEPKPEPEPEPKPEPEPEPEPVVVIPTLTPEEVKEMINQLNSSENTAYYIRDIDPKISEDNIDLSLLLDTPKKIAVALSNPDDMLVAFDYVSEKHPSQKDKLTESMRELLTMVKPQDINPDNAFALNELAKRAGFEDDQKLAIQTKIAQGLKLYDNEHFGDKTDEELAENYEQAQNLLANNEEIKKCGTAFLDEKFLIVDDKGKNLKDKELQKCKDSVIEMARELVAQDLAKEGFKTKNPDGTERDLTTADYEKKMQDKICMLIGTYSKPGKDGKTPVSHSQVVASMATHMVRSETFKSRAKQRGGASSKLYQSTTTWLKRLDERLTKRFGDKYTKAKKIAKVLGKVAIQSAIGSAKFLAISAVAGPVGVGVYMAYNTAKLWKNVGQELKGKSGLEKAAVITGKVVTSAISIGMVGAGLGDMLPAEGVGSLISNVSAHIAGSGILARTATTTLANSLPNLTKGWLLRRESKKIKKEIAAETDPEKIKALIDRDKAIAISRRNNKEELIIQTASAAVGTGVGLWANQQLQNLTGGVTLRDVIDGTADEKFANSKLANMIDRSENVADQTNGAKPDGIGKEQAEVRENIEKMLTQEKMANGEFNAPADTTSLANKLEAQFGSKAPEIVEAISKNPDEFLNQFSSEQIEQMGLKENATTTEILRAVSDTANNAVLSQVPDLNTAISQAAVQHQAVNTGDGAGATTSAEATAQNIEAAKNSVHPSGRSINDMATNDLAKLGIEGQEAKLIEGWGEKSYMAVHSAAAEPTTVVEALRATMPAEDFAKLGFDNSPSSAEVARTLINNPQLASNPGLQSFMDSHFNASQQFNWTPGVEPVHNQVQAQENSGGGQNTVDNGGRNDARIEQIDSEALKGKAEAMASATLLAKDGAGSASNNAEQKIEQNGDSTTNITINVDGKVKGDIHVNVENGTATITNDQNANPTIAATATAGATATSDTGDNVKPLFTDTGAGLIDQTQPQIREAVYGTPEWLVEKGLRYHARLSSELNHSGFGHTTSQDGYWAVAVDKNGGVHVLPNNPEEREFYYNSVQDAWREAKLDNHAFAGAYPIGLTTRNAAYYHPQEYYGHGYTTPYDNQYGYPVMNKTEQFLYEAASTVHAAGHLGRELVHFGEMVEEGGAILVNFFDRIAGRDGSGGGYNSYDNSGSSYNKGSTPPHRATSQAEVGNDPAPNRTATINGKVAQRVSTHKMVTR